MNEGYDLSPGAVDDLQEIWVYIAVDNLAAADKLEADINTQNRLLTAKNTKSAKRKRGVISDLCDLCALCG